jgi:hypothetical protein
MSGLNRVLSICMGSSLGAKTICLGCNLGGTNCFNVGDSSHCFSYWHSKSRLSQCIACTITWLKVVGSCMVNRRSFMSSQNPNKNWFMSLTSSHEMTHASYINSKVYTKARRDPWRIICNLLVAACSLFKLLKKTPNSSRNASKLFRRGD